jgi:hypothetical protein
MAHSQHSICFPNDICTPALLSWHTNKIKYGKAKSPAPTAHVCNTRTPAFSLLPPSTTPHPEDADCTPASPALHYASANLTSSSNRLYLQLIHLTPSFNNKPLFFTDRPTHAVSSVDLPRSRHSICHSLATSLVKVELENSSHCDPSVAPTPLASTRHSIIRLPTFWETIQERWLSLSTP